MAGVTAPARLDPRVVRSRRKVIEAATELFLRDGYVATTMDAIAAAAGVSKRTVYNNFDDKDALFTEVVLAASSTAEAFIADAVAELARPDDLRRALATVADALARTATSPRVVHVRRLIIGEAHRFPDLAAGYYRVAPGAVIEALAAAFAALADQGRLHLDDPRVAADQFAYLVVGSLIDRALFDGHGSDPDPAELRARAAEGTATFLARYAVPPS